MNRQQRRKAERKVNKEMDVMRKLPENEVLKINNIIEKVTKQRSDEMILAVDTSLSAVLINRGYDFKEVSKINDELAELMEEDLIKNRLLVKENVNMDKLQKEVKDFIINEIKSRQEKGEKTSVIKKQVIEATIFKFPKLSKAKATNAYGRVIEEMELEDAAKYIIEGDSNKKDNPNKKVEEIVEEVSKDLQEKIEKEEKELLNKGDVKVSRFKINKQEVIKKVEFEGDNGTYRAETGVGVELKANGIMLAFSTVQDLEKFYDEYRQAFELI